MLTKFEYPIEVKQDAAGFYLVTFPDLPEAATDGKTLEEALREAADCLAEALAGRIVDAEPIPEPSPVRRGQYQIAPEATLALKIALNQGLAARKMKAADLARLLDCDHKEARRLLDPREASKEPRLAEALAALGYGVRMALYDATKNERLLSAPVARVPHREKWGKTVRVEGKRKPAAA